MKHLSVAAKVYFFVDLDCLLITDKSSVDGGLSNWGQWTDCSRTCNGGLRRRTRTCSRPVPVLDGLDCESPRTEYEVCNNDTRCPCGML